MSSSIHFKLPHPSFLPVTRPIFPTQPRPLTIRAVSVTPSFYNVLEVSESGTLEEIKHAYKQMARKYHPDVSPPGRAEEYTERFIQVKEAYETLSDPKRRAVYDGDQEVEDKGEWKNLWQSQLSGLKRRSTCKNLRGNISWAEKIRRQRNDLSNKM